MSLETFRFQFGGRNVWGRHLRYPKTPPASLTVGDDGSDSDVAMVTTVLLDLDGVVRHFDPAHRDAAEDRHGLERGALRQAAFSPDILEPVITGEISQERWVALIGDRVGSHEAVHEWMAYRGVLDSALLALVAELRGRGTTVALLTNGTSATAAEVEKFGLANHFDAIFNTADIGFAKPDRRAFEAACAGLGVAPADVFFTDDSASKLAGAVEIDMVAEHFTDVNTLRYQLAQLGLLDPTSS